MFSCSYWKRGVYILKLLESASLTLSPLGENTGSKGFTAMCSNDTVQRKLVLFTLFSVPKTYRNHAVNPLHPPTHVVTSLSVPKPRLVTQSLSKAEGGWLLVLPCCVCRKRADYLVTFQLTWWHSQCLLSGGLNISHSSSYKKLVFSNNNNNNHKLAVSTVHQDQNTCPETPAVLLRDKKGETEEWHSWLPKIPAAKKVWFLPNSMLEG